MKIASKLIFALGLAASALLAAVPTQAQTTDGYHSIQVFPVVVDTASFTQRFTFHNPTLNNSGININVKYFPAVGTTQATPLDCGDYVLPGGLRTFTSLRQLCSGLASGSQFGFLYIHEMEANSAPFAAYSRVSNPQGNGFSVESFPAYSISSAPAKSIGVRRLAAGPSNPAFQTNCFVGGINGVSGAPAAKSSVFLTVYGIGGQVLGQTMTIQTEPGKMTRILDVFSFVGADPGDYDNAEVLFAPTVENSVGLLAFCTVQDNTSFGADFRIAKQRVVPNAFDSLYTRDARLTQSVNSSLGTSFYRVLPGGPRHNTHVMYFRHPDYVQCELINPATGVRALLPYGLEMRMLAEDGSTVLAGGNDQTGFGKIYLGDRQQTGGGYNARYTIDVETTGANDGVAQTSYDLRCQSGSGHSMGDLIWDNVSEDLF